MMTDFGSFAKARTSEDVLMNITSARSANVFGSESAAGMEKQANMSQQMNSLDTSHESVTSNYKKKRQMSMVENLPG